VASYLYPPYSFIAYKTITFPLHFIDQFINVADVKTLTRWLLCSSCFSYNHVSALILLGRNKTFFFGSISICRGNPKPVCPSAKPVTFLWYTDSFICLIRSYATLPRVCKFAFSFQISQNFSLCDSCERFFRVKGVTHSSFSSHFFCTGRDVTQTHLTLVF
jgi:hypothetical protein